MSKFKKNNLNDDLFKFNLGDEVKDKITGFTGTIIGRLDLLTGCNQYAVQPKCKEDNSKPKDEWFDEGKLKLVTKEKHTKEEVAAEERGCDMNLPNL